MNIVATFQVDSNMYFEIAIPDVKNNYYYDPTDKLDLFDEVSVTLCHNNKTILIAKDIVQAIFMRWQTALQNINQLPLAITVGELGKCYIENIKVGDLDTVNFSKFWLCSGVVFQVWIYEKNKQYYIEVSATPPNLFDDQGKGEITNYVPKALGKIDQKMINAWLKQCTEILQGAEKHHKKVHE